jgi:hypothetical protein
MGSYEALLLALVIATVIVMAMSKRGRKQLFGAVLTKGRKGAFGISLTPVRRTRKKRRKRR